MSDSGSGVVTVAVEMPVYEVLYFEGHAEPCCKFMRRVTSVCL